MRIANNIPALTAYNSLNNINNQFQNTIRQLSTGLRINSASDDAAGFAISEKMRSQISGLDVALRNSQDGISFLQTAEGALGQANSMLQRMRELAVQASNDTLTSNDRQYIQLEIDELKDQINRISDTTQFNKKRLLDGSSGAIWSSSDTRVTAKINSGLTYIDEYGQKQTAEGNYKIEVKANGGQGRIQKSNIVNAYYEEKITETKTETIEYIVDYEDKTFDPYEILINKSVDSAGNVSGPGWSFSNGVFTISADGNYNIVGNGTISPNRFVVNPGVKATIVLENVNIQTSNYSPFEMSGATVDMYLKGRNTLECKGSYVHGAGLQTSSTSNLTINSYDPNNITSGTLIATGTYHGAGIGGACVSGNPHSEQNCGTITIKGGTIIATGGECAAGIGSGSNLGSYPGNYNAITIEGGNVTARGGKNGGAGIGTAGYYSSTSITTGTTNPGQILITGGTINATGTDGGAGIGGGNGFNSGNIKISSNATVTVSGYTDPNATTPVQSIGEGNGGSVDSVTYTNNQSPPPNNPPVFPPVTVPVAIKVPQTVTTKVSETSTSRDSTLSEVKQFRDSNGVSLVKRPQTIKITQGDGKTTSVTVYELDTMEDVAKKINDAIANDLGQGRYADNQNKFCTLSDGTENTSESVFTKDFTGEDESVSDLDVSSMADTLSATMTTNTKKYDINTTMLVRSIIPGKAGEISFSGDEDFINALGLNTIQESEETSYSVTIKNAHTGKVINANLKMTGNVIHGVIDPDIDVDIEFDSMAGLKATWDEDSKSFVISHDELFEAMLHLKDNSTAFQIGANQGEDFLVEIGDCSINALGISSVNVTTRETASRAISIIDSAINKISTQRAKIGAYENALEHTMSSLRTTNLNLTNAESRIRDADMSKTMMEFVKLQILNQSGTSMLAQANQMPRSVLGLLQ